MDVNEVNRLLKTGYSLLDLSHTLEEGIPSWSTHARFGHTLYESYEFGNVACHYRLTMSEHTGTHMDAPLHFIPSGSAHVAIDEVPLQDVFGRAAKIDASHLPKNGRLSAMDVVRWEERNGKLTQGDIVLLRFGWEKLWGLRPNDQEFLRDWPGVGKDAAEYFVEKGVRVVGTDALAIDAFDAEKNPAHYTLLGNQVVIVENLRNLDKLPPFSIFVALPLKIKNGSGSPVRAIAFVPNNEQALT